jgi:hypothetical protein
MTFEQGSDWLANFIEFPQPKIGGGWPVIGYWAENILNLNGSRLWQKLLHEHACKSLRHWVFVGHR